MTVDDVKLSNNPDVSPGDESQTGSLSEVKVLGRSIATPIRTTSSASGAGENVPRVPPRELRVRDRRRRRYAFGFDVVAATDKTADGRANVNLDADGLADYAQIATRLHVILYVGTATFKEPSRATSCATARPNIKAGRPPSTFSALLQLSDDVRQLQNPDSDPATPLDGEEHERGIAFQSESVIAQVTIELPFWDSTEHDSPAHFDRSPRGSSAAKTQALPVTLDATRGVDCGIHRRPRQPPPVALPSPPPTDVHSQFTGAMAFDPHGDPACCERPVDQALRLPRLHDVQPSTQGHLNGGALCFHVRRNYAAPP